VLRHTWEKGRQYLKKMGGIILLASIVVWALGYFPVSENDVELSTTEQQEQSYLGRIGHAMEPVISPLGYDWRMGVGILAGVGAKELMVSTLGVLYDCPDEVVEDETLLQQALRSSGMTPEAALSYMVFALLYFPCLATIAAIRAESGRWKYAVFSALYTTGLAWCLAWVVYQVALMF
jgi:ferrous iron transport protein B